MWSVNIERNKKKSMSLYDILRVDRTSTREEIKRAYRQLTLEWHPDRNQHRKEQAEEHFKKILAAFAVLSDETTRHEYDSREFVPDKVCNASNASNASNKKSRNERKHSQPVKTPEKTRAKTQKASKKRRVYFPASEFANSEEFQIPNNQSFSHPSPNAFAAHGADEIRQEAPFDGFRPPLSRVSKSATRDSFESYSDFARPYGPAHSAPAQPPKVFFLLAPVLPQRPAYTRTQEHEFSYEWRRSHQPTPTR